jgi:single-stranded DNA-binding protein
MPSILGNIGTVPERKVTKSGHAFYAFRLAESYGKAERRQTTWYDIQAYVDEEAALLLTKGKFVKINGRLLMDTFLRKDGTPGASLTLITGKVEPYEAAPSDDDPA